MGLIKDLQDKRKEGKLEKIRKIQSELSHLTGEIESKTSMPERIDDAFDDLVRYGKIKGEVKKFLKSVQKNYREESKSLADEFELYKKALTKLEDTLLPVEGGGY